MALTVCAFGQTNNITPVIVTDFPSAISAAFHFVNINVNPTLLILVLHLLGKYYTNYHLADKFSHEINWFGKLASVVALIPIKQISPSSK